MKRALVGIFWITVTLIGRAQGVPTSAQIASTRSSVSQPEAWFRSEDSNQRFYVRGPSPEGFIYEPNSLESGVPLPSVSIAGSGPATGGDAQATAICAFSLLGMTAVALRIRRLRPR